MGYARGMSDPLAYFLTWACRGARLHGDDRGSIDRDHNRYDSPIIAPDPWREAGERTRMTSADTLLLNPQQRRVVREAISGVCEHRGWHIRALQVRANHVHIVVVAPHATPESVMQQCKSWATRRLREQKLIDPDHPLWTRHGSTRYIWKQPGLVEAIDYVLNQQDNPTRFPDQSEPRT